MSQKREKLKRRRAHETHKPNSEYLLEQIVKGYVAPTFPISMTALRLLLALSCGVASSDRSFSMLKRVKSQLRSTISQKRIVALYLIAANFDVLRALDPKKAICQLCSSKGKTKDISSFFHRVFPSCVL